jgi:hypothetical protein
MILPNLLLIGSIRGIGVLLPPDELQSGECAHMQGRTSIRLDSFPAKCDMPLPRPVASFSGQPDPDSGAASVRN